jgi:alkaline phosphatase D
VTHKVRNPVVVGGDRHAYFATNLKRDFLRPHEATIATEFVGTSITSQGPSESSVRNALAGNPELIYANGEKRGYAVMELDSRSCTVGFEAVDDVKDAHSAVRRLATFAVEDGVPGVKAA